MVSHLLGQEELDKDLEEIILSKTEGVPFFIEEFINSLNNLSIMERKGNQYRLVKDIHELMIPSNIQDVIMARVDSLPESAKEVIQIGSVIEREFKYELIKRVTDLPERELLSLLSVSKDSELLYERGIFPETSYIFKHALTRDVVYSSILGDRKKKLHEKTGNAIEELYKENMDEHYGVLAEHYITSENYEKGAEYSKLAAENAEKAGSIDDAIAYAKKRVTSLERLPRIDDVQKEIIDARTTLGMYWLNLFHYSEVKAAIDPVLDTALRSDYKRGLPQLLTLLGTYEYCFKEDVPKAFSHLEEALKIAEQEKDIASIGFATWRLGLALSLNCEFEKACYNFEKALDISTGANNLWAASRAKSYISSFPYFWAGRIDAAYKSSEEAIRLAEESGDLYSTALANMAQAISSYGKGPFEESMKRLQADRLDILQIHLIRSHEDVEKICAEDGVLKALRRLKDEKVTRFIGFSGHLSAEAMMEMANRFDFDTMLIALNHYSEHQGDFEKQAIPTAAEKKMGILAMKVIRPRETVEGLAADDLIRYSLSLKHVDAAVIGTDSLDVLKKNIHLVRNFKKMSPEEMKKISVDLEPVFAGHNLPWMDTSYTDGVQV